MSSLPYHEVQLAVYDLSRGMARSLSSQFLGPNHTIDIIPHTGIIVYGKEYYFGGAGGATNSNGGIVMTSNTLQFQNTHNLNPIQVMSLGSTNVPQQRFESWCYTMMNNGTYAGYNYDLIERNCNNFSHDAALKALGLSKGVPDWILNVPQRFISSPMGQLIRPMLQQMQLSGPSGTGGGVHAHAHSHANKTATANTQGNSSNGLDSMNQTSRGATTDLPSSDYNPWADIGTSSSISETTKSTNAATTTSATTETTNKVTNENDQLNHNTKKQKIELTSKMLDSYHKPLLSNDTNVVKICIKKLKQSKCWYDPNTCTIDSQKVQYSDDLLDELGLILLTNKQDKEQQIQVQVQENAGNTLSSTCSLFVSSLLQENKSTSSPSVALYILMLLRLIVLQPNLQKDLYSYTVQGVSKFISKIEMTDDSTYKRNAALRSMSWCVLSNAIGIGHQRQYVDNSTVSDLSTVTFFQNLVDTAIMDISMDENQEREENKSKTGNGKAAEIRQCACAYVYNFILFYLSENEIEKDGDIPDIIISILCGVAEGLINDQDSTTIMRRLLVIGEIIMSKKYSKSTGVRKDNENSHCLKVNKAAASLLSDIGYLDTLISLAANDAVLCMDQKLLAVEIIDAIKMVL